MHEQASRCRTVIPWSRTVSIADGVCCTAATVGMAPVAATGIEIEARPPGKRVKRLSLLSGGEKSLTALAFLVAIFRARPSPFYVLDEVEAALDDVNLRRLIALLEELRRDSQLIVITHQKPTMDVANVLYGVTMRGDGVTRVLSQRMQPAGAAPGAEAT